MKQGEKTKKNSLQKHIAIMVVSTMCALLVVQGLLLVYFSSHNSKKKQEYIKSMVNTIDSSLTAIGGNIEGLGSYISSYQAFQDLYSENNRSSGADSYIEAYNAVRFMATHTPIIKDIVVVGLNGIASSYYSAYDYSMVSLIEEDYSFTDENEIEKKFQFFPSEDYFVYIVPIQSSYSSLEGDAKRATALLICDLNYITELIEAENDVVINFHDDKGTIIVSNYNSDHEVLDNQIFTETVSQPMGITIKALNISYQWEMYSLLKWFFIISVIGIVLFMLSGLYFLNRNIARPIMLLSDGIITLDKINLKRRVPHIGITEIDQIIDRFNQILDENTTITKQIFVTQDKLYESELQKTQAEVQALQSQINPHFLYNTLQCIRSIAILDGSNEIAEITLAMSELFRYSIQPKDIVSFAEEIEIVKKYETINNIRFKYRFKFIYNIDEYIYCCNIIKMIIQPIIENATIHGVSKLEDGGTIQLNGWIEGNTVYISVSDNGPDIDEASVEMINKQLNREYRAKSHVKSLGLYNIHRRLILHYGDNYGLNFKRQDDLTTVTISFPFSSDSDDTQN